MRITETAYAKINLALHIRARRGDGYHELESLFAFAKDGDEVAAEPAETITLCVSGPFSEAISTGDDNLVMRAATMLRTSFGVAGGAAIQLDKRLPVASGIGGGSADGAATLRLLSRLWQIDVDDPKVREIARALGADVPACMASETAWGSGRGDDLIAVDAPALVDMPLLLVNPRLPLSTASVFAGWDGVDHGPLDPLDYEKGRNDLTQSAVALVPQIAALLDRLAPLPGVMMARMSGSGATCFALFATDAQRDAAAVHFRDEWCLVTRVK